MIDGAYIATLKQAMTDLQSVDAKRTAEVEGLLAQLDSAMKTLSTTQEQISKIPEMTSAVFKSGLMRGLEAQEGSIVEQVSFAFGGLVEKLWHRGIIGK